jgi:hypothetical protein
VDADEEGRKAILRQLAEERYVEEIRLAKESGTRGQFLSLMRERGLNGATAEKAITFYLHLAEHVRPAHVAALRPGAQRGHQLGYSAEGGSYPAARRDDGHGRSSLRRRHRP